MKEKKQSRRFIHILIGLVGLSLVIIIHELGHFLACKLFGVGTPIFSIGFGPSLLKIPIGQTIFQIAALPLGGYVAINPADMAAQPYINQLIIMIAGIVFNLIFAFVVFIFLSARGKYIAIPVVASVNEGSPAHKAGLQEGDVFVSIDGTQVQDNVHELIQVILDSPGNEIPIVVERNGKQVTIQITIATDHPNLGKNLGWLGVQLGAKHVKPNSRGQLIRDGIQGMKGTTRNMQQTLQKLFKEDGNSSGIIGPIGIISIAGKSLSYGVSFFFLILAILSINIAFFNVLPIPFLDGGHIASLTITKFFGPIPETVSAVVSRVFLTMLIFLAVLIAMKDILRLGRKNKD